MALPAVDDSPRPERFEPEFCTSLAPIRAGFSVEGYREGKRTHLFLQGTFDPALAGDLRRFLADLVTGTHELIVDFEGFTFLGTIGPSGLELRRQTPASDRAEWIAGESTKELRVVLDSLCISEALDSPESALPGIVVPPLDLERMETHEPPTKEERALRLV